jgi:hypothetical protein
VSARLIDGAGRVLDEEVENGVFLFMWKGNLNLKTARLDLLDASGQVVRIRPTRLRPMPSGTRG